MTIANLDDRAMLHVTGTDARPFLQGLLTNDLDRLAPERPLWAGLLSPQGKALFDMILFDDGAGGVLIDAERERTGDLARRLEMYRLRRAVTIEASPVGVLAAWDEDRPGWPADPRLAALGQRSPGHQVAGAVGADAYRGRRMAMGVGEGADELGVDRTLWLEANAGELGGVSFTKGCYVGQENTARMHHRATVRRRLLPLRLRAPPGDDRAVRAAGVEVGEVRAVAGDLAIAHLKLERLDAPLSVGDTPASLLWPDWLPRD